MCRFYSIIFVLIQLLENKGIRCEIWVIQSENLREEIMIQKLKLKNYTQPLNTYKIQFPIIASDFFRRIVFRLMETNPDIKDDWTDSYGRPLHTQFNWEKRKEIIKLEDNDIYIPSCQELSYRADDDLDETIEKIIQRTKLERYIKTTE